MSKIALITGGSRGIGLGIARHLAKLGFHLAINGVRPEGEVQESLDTLRRQAEGEVIYCLGNIGSRDDRDAILQQVDGHFGALHVLVNNAGVAPLSRLDILETTEESFDRVLDINLKGSFFLTQKAANWLIKQKKGNTDFSGCIINISSVSASTASVSRGEYCISKAGISMMTQLFSVRLGEFDIPVYEVRPGIIKTDMTSGVTEKYDKLFEAGIGVQNRWGTPDDVGKAVAGNKRGWRIVYS